MELNFPVLKEQKQKIRTGEFNPMGLLFYTDEYEPEVCKQMNKSLKKWYVVLIIMLIIASYCVTCVIVSRTRFRNYEVITNYSTLECYSTKQKLKLELSTYEEENLTRTEIYRGALELVPVKCFFYLDVKPWRKDALGGTLVVPRIVMVDPKLENLEYTIVLTHELSHLYYFTANEAYTTFMTFKILYESDNTYFKKAAITLALRIFANDYPSSYDCAGNILAYLNNEIDA